MEFKQRFGLTLILATLLVMTATGYLLFEHQRDDRESLARAQGIDLVRLLGGMGWRELVSRQGKTHLLELLARGQSNPDFAYGVVVDLDGRIVNQATRPGVIVPQHGIGEEPAGWFAQRRVDADGGRRSYIESHAPLFDGSRHRGFVRLGYREPSLDFAFGQMPFLATLMLPIFLLVPLCFFLLRQEIKPLARLGERFDDLALQAGITPVELQPGPDLSAFMDRFGRYIEATQQRLEALNREHETLEMSGKLLTYRNNRSDAILQNFPDAILVVDEAGDVGFANARAGDLLGVDHREILGDNPRNWCPNPEILPLLTIGDGKSSVQASQQTLELTLEGQGQKTLQFGVYPLFAPADETRILGRLVVVRDVSELRSMRQRQNEFVSHVSHELKTPLNVLSMYSESLLTEGADNAEYRIEAVNVIRDEVERLSTLINNLLAINQYELGGVVAQRKHVRMHEFLEDIFDNIRRSRRGKSLEFVADIPAELGMAFIDKDMFRIAINNLLTNAIKYSKPGGRVELSALDSDDFIEILVSDEGYGIAEQDRDRIFDKFFRSTDDDIRQQVGHGLGLSLTRQIVLMHHGELTFTSETGKGSQFRIRLEKVSTQIVDAEAS